jgi:predicted PhzF superfamily epimerase YddE/YHI9
VNIVVVRVFVDDDGRCGSPLGVVFDGPPAQEERQQIAVRLAYSETVFVDDVERGVVDIYTPHSRLEFAGYPLIGAAWALRHRDRPVEILRPRAGEVATWLEADTVWLHARTSWLAGRRTQQYGSAREVDALPAPPPGVGWLYAWAWEDEPAGRIRARGFPRRGDSIVEDEATGAAALALTAEPGRDLHIRQGTGSRIRTRYLDRDHVALGGRCS